jgi:fimbrial chaperone protein
MIRAAFAAASVAVALSISCGAAAQSLRISPVTIELPVNGKSTVVTVGNDMAQALNVQAMVYKWTQKDGKDVLEKTSDVVVSPPVFSVKKGSDNALRLVRVNPAPVQGEETYRVTISELPSREKVQAGGVITLMQHNVPVFFAGMDAKPSSLTWSVSHSGSKLLLHAVNNGQKRAKLSGIHVMASGEKEVAKIEGMAGYVLGGQSRSWELESPQLAAGTSVTINATTETGPVNASVLVGKSG